jgi:hypothetical protein
MGDYKGIFAQEDFSPAGQKRIEKGTFLINLVSRKTRKVFWTGTVEAHSPKSAQAQWRIDYADVRGMFDHSYALTIKRI